MEKTSLLQEKLIAEGVERQFETCEIFSDTSLVDSPPCFFCHSARHLHRYIDQERGWSSLSWAGILLGKF